MLFVDYMAEHLTPTGRAGIIVPEGIIFQSQTAYTQLRKMLVEEYLVAVVSLPAGVFNPYSGVKTSILILDRSIARESETIAFFKVDNDGFGLGAQRRAFDKNDLPQVQGELAAYLQALRSKKSVADLQSTCGLIVPKEKIAANGDYNLSGERYREGAAQNALFPHVRLDEMARITAGNSAPQGDEYFAGGDAPFIRTSDVGAVHLSDNFVGAADKLNAKAIEELRLELFPAGTILFPKSGASTFLNHRAVMGAPAYVSSHLACIICDEKKALPKYVYSLLCRVDARSITPDQAYPSLRLTEIGAIEIPLPPPEVQKEIVAEIEGYQKVINGARAVLDHYRPHIPIRPDWPMVPMNEVAAVESGFGFPLDYQGKSNEEIPFLKVSDMNLPGNEKEIVSWNHSISREVLRELKGEAYPKGTVIFPKIGAAIATNKKRILTRDSTYDNNVMGIIPNKERLLSDFLHTYLLAFDLSRWASESQPPSMRKTTVEAHEIPLPPLAAQQAIVAEIEAEQALVAANCELITRFEQKIQVTLSRVWGEGTGDTPK